MVETYPAEACVHLDIASPGRGWSKRNREDRAKHYKTLSTWAKKWNIKLSSSLDANLRDGFGPSKDGEDPFDATLGIFSMLEVVLGHRPDGSPQDSVRRRIEGWIFGQAPSSRCAKEDPWPLVRQPSGGFDCGLGISFTKSARKIYNNLRPLRKYDLLVYEIKM